MILKDIINVDSCASRSAASRNRIFYLVDKAVIEATEDLQTMC